MKCRGCGATAFECAKCAEAVDTEKYEAKLEALARALLKARHTAGEAEAAHVLATHLKGGTP